ncbi:MAG: hypothetical protein M3Y41_04515, partial [Pseudomonadota bacterium]|nr:hypothetical protein [Pseudomonadota bacterium]
CDKNKQIPDDLSGGRHHALSILRGSTLRGFSGPPSIISKGDRKVPDTTITIRRNGQYIVGSAVELKDADGTIYPVQDTIAPPTSR